MDDITVTSDDLEEIHKLKNIVDGEFEIKDLGRIRYFLEMEIARSKKGISVSLKKYIMDLLQETRMLGYKPTDIPVDLCNKPGKEDKR